MNNVEIEIVRKANEAFLATDNDKKLTDAKLMQIANEVETDGAKKHADLLFSLAEEYNLPTDKCFVILEEHRQAYRQSQLDEIENKIIDIAHFGKNIEIGEKPDYDKLLIALKERETLKNHSKAEMVNAKKSLLKDLKKIESEAKESVIKTGFSKLDEKLGGGLRNSRLYGLGGISSLGKTTLVLNIVENIAKAGRDVLIFSLEMARTELLAKILSKNTFEPVLKKYQNENDFEKWKEAAKEEAVSLIDLYNANYNKEKEAKINEFTNKYLEEIAPRLNIMEGIGNITVATVRNTVEMFIEKNRPEFKPVVIIDFLQILSPLNERSTDKQIVDRNISELKRLTRDLDIAVIAISSFNRQSYANEVSFESFKESGSVEYSVDVLIGLQLLIKEREKWTQSTPQTEKRQAIDEAKRKNPREIELVILKNRIYKTGQSVFFKYYSAYDYFTDDGCEDLSVELKNPAYNFPNKNGNSQGGKMHEGGI